MRSAATAILTVLLLSFTAARADKPADNKAAAKQHFETGLRAYNVGEFETAAEEYKLAYKLNPDPVLLYNCAQAYRLANKLSDALLFYRSYLRNVPNATNRAAVQERIQLLETQLTQQRQLTAPPNEAVALGSQPDASRPTPPPAEPTPAPAATTPSEPPNALTASPTPATETKPPRRALVIGVAVGSVVVVVGLALGLGLGLGLQDRNPQPSIAQTVRGN